MRGPIRSRKGLSRQVASEEGDGGSLTPTSIDIEGGRLAHGGQKRSDVGIGNVCGRGCGREKERERGRG